MRTDPATSGGASWLDTLLYDSSLPIVHILLASVDPAISDYLPTEANEHAAANHG
jgi:hypothetical protein